MCWRHQVTLETAGGTMADVTMNHIFLKDLADYAAFNTVYAEYFPGAKPARYCIKCGLVKPDCLVEIASRRAYRLMAASPASITRTTGRTTRRR